MRMERRQRRVPVHKTQSGYRARYSSPRSSGILTGVDKGDTSTGDDEKDSHSSPAAWVDAAMLLRCNSLIRSHSGFSYEVIDAIVYLICVWTLNVSVSFLSCTYLGYGFLMKVCRSNFQPVKVQSALCISKYKSLFPLEKKHTDGAEILLRRMHTSSSSSLTGWRNSKVPPCLPNIYWPHTAA